MAPSRPAGGPTRTRRGSPCRVPRTPERSARRRDSYASRLRATATRSDSSHPRWSPSPIRRSSRRASRANETVARRGPQPIRVAISAAGSRDPPERVHLFRRAIHRRGDSHRDPRWRAPAQALARQDVERRDASHCRRWRSRCGRGRFRESERSAQQAEVDRSPPTRDQSQ
jgi:hypothetical protein